MKKVIVSLLTLALVLALCPVTAMAAGVAFSISGPGTLQKGETGTYKVIAKVSDAAAVSATLHFDGGFFELVSGNLKGEWDTSNNTGATVTLITVTLRCIGDVGSSGSLSLSAKKASRYTGSDPPSESVSCSGGSKTVTNPAPTPTPVTTPRVKPSQNPSRTDGPPSNTKRAQAAWPDVESNVANAPSGSAVDVQIDDEPEVPVTLLDVLKNKKSSLRMNFGEYTCTVDGNALNTVPPGVASIDLSMKMDKDASLSGAVGGNDAYQLHFKYSGELPGKITYTIKAANNKPGDTVYLYYYYESAGVAEGIEQAIVDDNGYMTFAICHCSDYIVTNKPLPKAMGSLGEMPPAQNVQAQAKPAGVPVAAFVLSMVAAVVGTALFTKYFLQKKGVKPPENEDENSPR